MLVWGGETGSGRAKTLLLDNGAEMFLDFSSGDVDGLNAPLVAVHFQE